MSWFHNIFGQDFRPLKFGLSFYVLVMKICNFTVINTTFLSLKGSNDQTVRLWDLAAGKSMCTLTHHKKSVRAVVLHPKLYMFASASPDNIKEWKCPDGKFIQNLSGHNAIVNCMAANADGVLVSGADNGTMHFWDWKTGYNFQRLQV